MNRLNICIGYQILRPMVSEVAQYSFHRRTTVPLHIMPLMYRSLRAIGLYTRPTEERDGQLWDVMSHAPMSTEFSLSRFLIPFLVPSGWALWCDDDVLCLDDVAKLFARADDRYAVMAVKHDHVPTETVKLDGKKQTAYTRKNWSSVVLWNCDHPAHRERFSLDAVNHWSGLDLHQFCWLRDDEIGSLPVEWNWLEGTYDWPETNDPLVGTPSLVHFTRGGPWLPNWQNVQFASLWRRELAIMLASNAPVRQGGETLPKVENAFTRKRA